MLKLKTAFVLALLAGAALAQEPSAAIGDETTNAAQGKDKAESRTVAAAETKASDEVVVPPGFKKKKRGEHIVYCIKGKATGTRFPSESCYDEAGLAEYILKREAGNRAFEQNRAICSNPATCASP